MRPVSASKRTATTWPCAQSPLTSTLWPRASSSARTSGEMRASDRHHAGPLVAGVEAVAEVRAVEAVGASIASCRSIPKSTSLRKNCSVHWSCAVAAGRAEHHARPAVLRDQGGRERGARPLAGLQAVGVRGVEEEHLRPRAQREAQPRDDRRGAEPAAAGGDGDHVPVAVDHVELRGVAAVVHRPLRPASPAAVRGLLAEPLPGRSSSEARFGSTSLRRLSAYSFESSRSSGTSRELRVAVVGLAVREGQLGALDHGVNVVRTVVRPSPPGRSPPAG